MVALHPIMKLRLMAILCGIALVIMGGCIAQNPPAQQTRIQPTATAQPTPAPTPTPAAYASLRTQGGNLRSGPGTNFPVVRVIGKGDTYPIVGRNEVGDWWQLCCVPDPADETGETPITAWVAASIVDVEGDAEKITGQVEQLDRGEPLFGNDFTARWKVTYRCDSKRCEVAECTGEVNACVRNLLQNDWLEIDRNVTWLEDCGDDTAAQYQIHRYSGRDRYIGEGAAFFDRYWVGTAPGEPTKTITLANGQIVQTWCTGPQSFESQEDENWITVYDGEACYDIQTGMLLTLSHSKRWLFTGVANGQRYERAFFGDTEYYDFELESTNARLSSAK